MEIRGKDLNWHAVRGGYRYYNPKWGDEEGPTCLSWVSSSRDYSSFGRLAGVRRHIEGLGPLDEPRGLPDDVSLDIQEESDEYGIGGHSHSFFTLAELLEHDWSKTEMYDGEEYPLFGLVQEVINDLTERAVFGPEDARFVFWFDN